MSYDFTPLARAFVFLVALVPSLVVALAMALCGTPPAEPIGFALLGVVIGIACAASMKRA